MTKHQSPGLILIISKLFPCFSCCRVKTSQVIQENEKNSSSDTEREVNRHKIGDPSTLKEVGKLDNATIMDTNTSYKQKKGHNHHNSDYVV